MEYTKRIGMISGPYIKIASTKGYNTILTNKLEILDQQLEMRKQVVYEQNMRSKMIVVYTIEKYINQIDLQLTRMKTTTYQYFSFKHSSPEERIAAMHANELINVKAWYETLYNVKVETSVKYNNEEKSLGTILKEVNHNSCPFFLAVETRSGVNQNNVHIVINPRVKLQAAR